ncbi:dioxygenase [Bacillaceae bacterium SAOS 7]|nr:dioxygenase [Bacillaceae bacterium SAOS 7]
MMPSLFLPHGSPMIAIEDTDYTRFLRKLGESLKPKAVVLFTAHWESAVMQISSRDDEFETIYDFGGFPPALYEVTYPAKGSTVVAKQLQERFQAHAIESELDTKRGLDHGTWTLLTHLFPNADVPVVQVSVHPFLPPEEQIRIGEAVKGLGAEDILVIGSGVTVHNLRLLNWGQKTPEDWAVQFDDWLLEQLDAGKIANLTQYKQLAPFANQAVPREEHFVPFFIALGAGNESEPKVLFRDYDLGTLSYMALQF